jgi:hypothetical protein
LAVRCKADGAAPDRLRAGITDVPPAAIEGRRKHEALRDGTNSKRQCALKASIKPRDHRWRWGTAQWRNARERDRDVGAESVGSLNACKPARRSASLAPLLPNWPADAATISELAS